MAKSLAALQEQIKKLQDQADALKRKEAVGVIDKIKTAIAFYGLTSADLFGGEAVESPKRAVKSVRATMAKKPAKQSVKEVRKIQAVAKKAPKPPKYTDGTRFWTGHGQRPGWFKDALSAGKSLEDLAVKSH